MNFYLDTKNILAINRTKKMLFAATGMNLEIIILSEVILSSQRKTNIIWYHLHVEPKKIVQMNLFIK